MGAPGDLSKSPPPARGVSTIPRALGPPLAPLPFRASVSLAGREGENGPEDLAKGRGGTSLTGFLCAPLPTAGAWPVGGPSRLSAPPQEAPRGGHLERPRLMAPEWDLEGRAGAEKWGSRAVRCGSTKKGAKDRERRERRGGGGGSEEGPRLGEGGSEGAQGAPRSPCSASVKLPLCAGPFWLPGLDPGRRAGAPPLPDRPRPFLPGPPTPGT